MTALYLHRGAVAIWLVAALEKDTPTNLDPDVDREGERGGQ
jgi:hypothetical protein